MEQTQELLRAIMGRLEELSAEVKGLRTGQDELRGEVTGLKSEVTDLKSEVTDLKSEVKEFRADVNQRLDKIDERLDHLALKWMEHDEEIHKIKRRQA